MSDIGTASRRAAAGVPYPRPLAAPEVVLKGRTHQATRAGVWLSAWVLTVLSSYGFVALLGHWPDTSKALPGHVLLGVILLGSFLRLWMRRGAVTIAAAQARMHEKAPGPVGDRSESAAASNGESPLADFAGSKAGQKTAVVCSGGGIKSATFSLGALQRLQQAKVLSPDVDLVAVSGGGYMAAAWVVAAYRARSTAHRAHQSDGDRPTSPAPLADLSEPVNLLRGRTNYLWGKARLDLVASVVLGMLVTVLLLGGPAIAYSWILSQFALGIEIVDITPSGVIEFGKDGALFSSLQIALLPAGVFALLGLAVFSYQRFSGKESPSCIRILFGWLAGVGKGSAEVITEAAATSARLMMAALVYVIFVPGLLWVTVNKFPDVVGNFWGFVSSNTALIAAAATIFTTLIGIAHAGAKAKRAESIFGAAWRLLSRSIAPTLALLLIAGLAYYWLAGLVAEQIKTPMSGWLVLILAISTPLFVWMINSNLTSVFPFYRTRLEYAYLGASDDVGQAHQLQPTTRSPSLAELTARSWPSTAAGQQPRCAPKLTLVSTANASSSDRLPTGRNGSPFVLSDEVGFQHSFGPYGQRTVAAKDYRYAGRKGFTVADAIAISGAAISPAGGRESKRLGSWRILLALANIRLGVWVRNPYYAGSGGQRSTTAGVAEGDGWLSRKKWALLGYANTVMDEARAVQVVVEAVGSLRIDQPYLYLSDGGHFDNTGLVTALGLRQRPSLIYLVDGSGDDEDGFAGVGDAVATARMDLGIEVDFDPQPMMRHDGDYPPRAWQKATARYPDGGVCTIIYLKAVLPAGLTWDLYAFQKRNPAFPVSLQRFESFDEFDFEAYRQLGWAVTESALLFNPPEDRDSCAKAVTTTTSP